VTPPSVAACPAGLPPALRIGSGIDDAAARRVWRKVSVASIAVAVIAALGEVRAIGMNTLGCSSRGGSSCPDGRAITVWPRGSWTVFAVGWLPRWGLPWWRGHREPWWLFAVLGRLRSVAFLGWGPTA
jgi:hypothetical protein